jgi:1-acylglycerone phosphate reductase
MPLGVEVIEIVTGYVRSNILRDGYVVPEDSPYLSVLPFMEQIKTHGRDQAMEGRTYAKIVVAKVMRKSASTEIWEGGQAWVLHYLTLFTPQTLLVSISHEYAKYSLANLSQRWFLFWYFKLFLVKGREQPVFK